MPDGLDFPFPSSNVPSKNSINLSLPVFAVTCVVFDGNEEKPGVVLMTIEVVVDSGFLGRPRFRYVDVEIGGKAELVAEVSFVVVGKEAVHASKEP